MSKKFASRKFQALIGGILIAFGSALANKMGWDQSIISIVVLIMSYFGVEGAIDVARIKASK